VPDPKISQKAPFVKAESPGTKHWCACGHTQNGPYCDGSHKKVPGGFTPVAVEIKEARQVAWCGCKHSATKPFCDGSHKRLP
jgi:CDGSH-type Zn-finger protein